MQENPIDTIAHHFGKGYYIKSVCMKAGDVLVQHKHKTDHVSTLVSGTVQVSVDGWVEQYKGPVGILIKAGKHHGVKALTDAVWLCTHADDGTDPGVIDEVLVMPGSNVEDMKRVAGGML